MGCVNPFSVVVSDITINRLHQLWQCREARGATTLHFELPEERFVRAVVPWR